MKKDIKAWNKYGVKGIKKLGLKKRISTNELQEKIIEMNGYRIIWCENYDQKIWVEFNGKNRVEKSFEEMVSLIKGKKRSAEAKKCELGLQNKQEMINNLNEFDKEFTHEAINFYKGL